MSSESIVESIKQSIKAHAIELMQQNEDKSMKQLNTIFNTTIIKGYQQLLITVANDLASLEYMDVMKNDYGKIKKRTLDETLSSINEDKQAKKKKKLETPFKPNLFQSFHHTFAKNALNALYDSIQFMIHKEDFKQCTLVTNPSDVTPNKQFMVVTIAEMKENKTQFKTTFVNNCKSKFAAAIYNTIKKHQNLLKVLNEHHNRLIDDPLYKDKFEYTVEDLQGIMEIGLEDNVEDDEESQASNEN